MKFRLIPTDDKFFDLFNGSAANVAECARRLRDLVSDNQPDVSAHRLVAECEHRGDDIVQTILQRLNTTFVTPFDREDIHALAEELDDVVDDMLTVSRLIETTKPTTSLPEVKELADVMVEMADETVALISRLESMKGITPYLESIDRLESAGDTIYRQILGRLFGGEFEALEVLRWKGVVEALEGGLNTLEDVSNIVESIVLKHA